MIIQHIEANSSVLVDIGVKHLAHELDCRAFEGILLAEIKFECKNSSFPDGVVCSFDIGNPEHEVLFDRPDITVVFSFVCDFLEIPG